MPRALPWEGPPSLPTQSLPAYVNGYALVRVSLHPEVGTNGPTSSPSHGIGWRKSWDAILVRGQGGQR